MKNRKRFNKLCADINKEVEFVDVKQYSHNIITWTLRTISTEFGYNKSNEVIDKFDLTSLGWKHETEQNRNT